VVEVANWTFVPAAGAVLADLGADVIKVESPTGDPQRALTNLLNLSDDGPNPFLEVPNRGKRSFTADLSLEGGRGALARVLATADVFLTSNLAPIRRKLHIEVEDIRAANPQIIYVRGTGWGAHGPMADVGGYDVACGWATSGMAYKMSVGGDPLTQPPAFFDLQGANTIAGAVGMALFKRERTGETSVIDVSLMHVGMWALSPDITGSPFSGATGLGDLPHQRRPLALPGPAAGGALLGRAVHPPRLSRADRRRAIRRRRRPLYEPRRMCGRPRRGLRIQDAGPGP
jgi:formyl-CoA transferase